jgi:sugar phosphate permease
VIASLLSALKPAPVAAPITDPGEVDLLYRRWRAGILYGCFVGYTVFYLCRRNIPLAFPAMAAEFGWSKAALGSIESAGHIAYGLGKFSNGVLADHTNPRYFMALGLLLTALTNVAFGFHSSLLLLALVWGLNGWFQSMGFPPGARLLSHWFSPREHGWIWGIYGCSHQVGTAIVSIAAGYLVVFGWRYVFFAPAAVAALVSLWLLNRLRDVPSSMGLPPVELYRREVTDPGALEAIEKPVTAGQALLYDVLNNRLIWFVAVGNFFLYVSRYGVNTWLPMFLSEERGMSIAAAGWMSAVFESGGVLGMLAAGWISDRLFHTRRGPVMALFMGGVALAMLAFWRAGSVPAYVFALGVCGFLVYGPLMLVSVAAAGFAGKKAAATAAGFCGFWGYMGATVSGAGVGKIVDVGGWRAGFAVLIASCLLSSLFFALNWNAMPRALSGRARRARAN